MYRIKKVSLLTNGMCHAFCFTHTLTIRSTVLKCTWQVMHDKKIEPVVALYFKVVFNSNVKFAGISFQ